MRFSKRSLRTRIKALESYLGVVFVVDRWGDPEVIDAEYSNSKAVDKRLNRIEKKIFTDKERKDFLLDD